MLKGGSIQMVSKTILMRPRRALPCSTPFLRQQAKLTGPGAQFSSKSGKSNGYDPFNTPLALQNLRQHLGLSRYAATAKEAELGRSNDSIISRINTDGHKGTILGVEWKAHCIMVDIWTEAIRKTDHPDVKSRFLPSDTEKQIMRNFARLVMELDGQVAWGRGLVSGYSLISLAVSSALFWWMNWPPLPWIRKQIGNATEKSEPQELIVSIVRDGVRGGREEGA